MVDLRTGGPDAGNYCGVVVTYHPQETVVENLQAMVRECGLVLVVDNGSAEEVRVRMAAVPGVTVLALGANLGVATALNRGAAWARTNGYAWVVTFDQDSRPLPGLAAALWATHLRLPAAAGIGPRIQEAKSELSRYRWLRRHPRWPGCFQRVRCDGRDLEEIDMFITSGSMIELETWHRLGGFDEALFIDYVDTDYCLRVRRAGRSLAVSAAAILDHRMGERRRVRVLGVESRPTHHAAFRLYYIARNRVFLWRKHALALPHWALFDLTYAVFNVTRVLVFEPAKWTKLKATWLGTWDALRGRSGPAPEHRLKALRT